MPSSQLFERSMQKQFLKPTSLEVEIKFYEEPVNLTEKDIPDLDNLS